MVTIHFDLAGRISPIPQHTQAPSNEELLQIKLDAWIETGGAAENQENRKEAAERILNAYHYKDSVIIFDDLNLTELPDVFDTDVLKCNLNALYMQRNQLTTLPESLKYLDHLKELDLVDNPMQILPEFIFELANLEILSLESTQLMHLSPKIENLDSLKTLDLSNTPISFLPESISNLTNLVFIGIKDCKNLHHIPLVIGNCRELTFMNANGTQVPRRESQAIVDRAQALRDSGGTLLLVKRIKTWMTYCGVERNPDHNYNFLSDPTNFTAEEQEKIHQWLLQYEKMKEDNEARKEMVKAICNTLHTLRPPTNEERKTAFFNYVDEILFLPER